ncbi:MAG: hypothetical protein KGH61_05225 [Candidatus Micrarchaeota archaeon]|nr:hypothetical protein [Candidatus Micrarchaeota archaeon]MDE1848316.1 hypothetical protein [Candidatus Micrarchaeota archaeon]MDE1864542.1 hypothetical protein [Candidatus Micrarchaeota archaeon]
MQTWKAITGIILLVIGALVAFQGYGVAGQCSSALGQVGTFVSSILGGSGAQGCYNAHIAEYGGIIIAIIGLIVIYSAATAKQPARKTGRK